MVKETDSELKRPEQAIECLLADRTTSTVVNRRVMNELKGSGTTKVTADFLGKINPRRMSQLDWQEIYEGILAPRLEQLLPFIEADPTEDGVLITPSEEYAEYMSDGGDVEQAVYGMSKDGLEALNCALETYERGVAEMRRIMPLYRSPRLSDYESEETVERYVAEGDPGNEEHWEDVRATHRGPKPDDLAAAH